MRAELYVVENNGVLAVLDARTGERRYQERLGKGGAFTASPVAAEGVLYVRGQQHLFAIGKGT